MAKIKPCPFCGQPAKLKFKDSVYRVVCESPGCASHYSYYTKEAAIKEWNTRTRPQKEVCDG